MTLNLTNASTRAWPRRLVILGLALSLSACATYRPSEAECFTAFAEVTRSNCTFEILNDIGPIDG